MSSCVRLAASIFDAKSTICQSGDEFEEVNKMAVKKSQVEIEYRDEDFEDIEQQENADDLRVTSKDFEDLFVAPADWTIGSLVGLIGNQIKLDPEFQRRGVWTEKAKIRFIESLFVNIPIPQILLAPRKEDKNAFIILDGKQRLLTIKEFCEGKFDTGKEFVLQGLRLAKDLNGKSWRDIQKLPIWTNRFLNHTQRSAIVKGWKNDNVLYEIFHRLNSGSVGLSPMELRTSLHRGEFLRSIIEWTETTRALHTLLRLKRPDRRMADVELTLRFIAFSQSEVSYEGDLKEFLDETTRKLNNAFRSLGEQRRIFDRLDLMELAIESATEIFGPKHVCRKWKDGKFESRFNRAVFDIVVGSLSVSEVRAWAIKRPAQFERAFVETCKGDREFLASLETSTKNLAEVRRRFTTWYGVVEKLTGAKLKVPKMAPSK